MRKTTTGIVAGLAACVLAAGLCACSSGTSTASSSAGTGDNSAIVYTSLEQDTTQTFQTVTFGTYEQDGNTSNGAEAIEWYVLDEQDGKALLISKYVLDAQPYDDTYVGYTWYVTNPRPVTDATWNTSSIREWLNGTFYNKAFTADEQSKIVATTSTDSKAYGSTSAASSPDASAFMTEEATDNVFLLSNWEAKSLFANKAARMAQPTAYAIAQGVYVNGDSASDSATVGYASWWTRTVGYYAGYAAVVMPDGEVEGDGYRMDGETHDAWTDHGEYTSTLGGNFGIRPAIWVDSSVLA